MTVGEQEIEVKVVLWRTDGGTVAELGDCSTMAIRTDHERALALVADDFKERTGHEVAILDLTATHLHLELLSASDANLQWRDPITPITGTALWNKPGWFTKTRAKIESSLAETVGASRVGPIRQVKHWSISALLEVASNMGTFWFKQVPSFMAHEGGLTAWLATRRPGAVPDVVATGPDWSITRAFDPPSEERTLESPYGLLAEIQLDIASWTAEMLELGCPERTSSTLVAGLAALAHRSDILDPGLSEQVEGALPRIRELVEKIDGLPIPSSLVHGDLHGGNWTRASDGKWLIFDWTDGCVSHPFFDLGVLPQTDVELREARLGAYLEPWRTAFGDAAVAETLDAALPLASGFHALSYERIVDGVDAADSNSWKPSVTSFVTKLIDACTDAHRD